MGEQDRLAALLERATRERRGGVDGTASDESDLAESSWERAPGERDEALDGPLVTGGEWLPPDPGRHRTDGVRPPLLTLPRSLRSVDLSVRPVAVLALLIVALVAAGVFGLRWWQAERGSAPVPLAPLAVEAAPVRGGSGDAAAATAGEADGAGAGEEGMPTGADPGAAAGDAGPTAPTELLVHVTGAVRSPGVVRLEPGARVHDAVDSAGGLGADADTSRLNLARVVADGERIWVPRPGEEVPEVADGPVGAGGAGSGASQGAVAGGQEAGGVQQININTADQAVLEELPGVGPVTATAILQWRTEHGRFSSPDELLEVSGIGEATLEKLRPHVTL